MIKDRKFSLCYLFDLQSSEDGVTVEVPIEAVGFLQEEDFSWLVPGLLAEKIFVYLKALPKNIRSHLFPLPLHVNKAMLNISPKEGTLAQALRLYLQRELKLNIAPNVWHKVCFPACLLMHFKIMDEHKNVLAMGDDLPQLYEQLKTQYPQLVTKKEPLERKNILQWDFANLPTEILSKQQGYTITYFPALVDDGQSVHIQLFDSLPQAQFHHRTGLVRLYLLQLKEETKYAYKQFFQPHRKTLAKRYVPFGQEEECWQDLLIGVTDTLFVNKQDIRSQYQFQYQLENNLSQFMITVKEYTEIVNEILSLHQVVSAKLNLYRSKFPAWAPHLVDIEKQLDALLPARFISVTPLIWLRRYPLYLKAIIVRLDKLPLQVVKDKQWMDDIAQLQKKYHIKLSALDIKWRGIDEPLMTFRWKIEELRLSYFAQILKTAEPVSKIRLMKLLESFS